MLASTIDSTDIVFTKTEKGREEMATRSHGLNPSQRRILIPIDGRKTVTALAEINAPMAASGQFEEILAFLAEQGFIEMTGSESASQAASPAVTARGKRAAFEEMAAEKIGRADAEEELASLREVKDFMTTTAQTYLGLLSASLIQRIEQARNASQLMSVVGQWNMALRDSAQGRRFADAYLEQVRAALAGGVAPALATGS